MSESVVARFDLTPEVQATAAARLSKFEVKKAHLLVWIFMAMLVVVPLGSAVLIARELLAPDIDWEWIAKIGGFSVVWFGGLFIVLRSWLATSANTRKMRRAVVEGGAVEWRFGQADVIRRVGSDPDERLPWGELGVVRFADGFVLTNTVTFVQNWLPTAAFPGPAEVVTFAELAQREARSYQTARTLDA